MAAEDIRLIVERCYSIPPGLTSNPLDQLNPSVQAPSASAGPVAAEVDPSAVIRDLVGRCYSLPVPNDPNPLDQINIPAAPVVPQVDPPPSPGQVIRQLVERCYPPLPPIPGPPPDLPGLPPPTRIEEPPWLPWLITWTGAPCSEFFCFPITLDPPTPPYKPPTTKHGPGPDDCDLVAKYLQNNKLRDLPDYEEVRDGKLLKSPGWWEHIETGEKYYCDLSTNIDLEWNECVRNAMECMFRPYFGGRWQPPRADCSAYWPKGWSGNLTEICVQNCYPDRLPIYESFLSSGTLNVTFNSVGDLVATGSGTATVVLKLQWNDRVNTYGTAVSTISLGGKTWTQSGRSGEEIHTLNLTSAGTTQISFTGLNAANNPLVILDNNTRLCLKDGGGSDCNANFSIVSVNLGADHAYDPQGAKAGYTLTNSKPGFYILKEPIQGVTVPLFRFYSTQETDTFLTTNPGQPDSPGAGERVTMDNSDMVFQEVIGHVFETSNKMSSYLAEKETAAPLHRLWSPDPFNHKYTITGDFTGGVPVQVPNKWVYKIPSDPKGDLQIKMDVEHGNAGYRNTMGFYLANENGPQWGVITQPLIRSGVNLTVSTIPSQQLQNFAGGTMGFFLISNGAQVNPTFQVNQVIDFEPLNAPYSGGFRGTGINSSQSNYCLFGDNEWNPMKKDQTKWHGRSHQFWEDLIAGDDDYNDLKIWHDVRYTFDGYTYEGIQCYVYPTAAPEKVFRKLNNETKCESRIITQSFKTVIMRRQDCGTKLPTFQSNDVDWECGECNGAYSTELNKTQTIAAKAGGTFRMISMGGITGGLQGDCTKFTIKMQKNGVDLFTKQFEAKYWPNIGADLWDGDISLSPNDTLTFEVVSIDTGPVTGDISLELAMFDKATNNFDSVFKLQLGTVSGDDVQGSTAGNPTNNPINKSDVGFVQGFAMQFRPTNRQEFEWEPGSKWSETWNNDNTPDPGYPWTNVWSGGVPIAMHGTNQANPDIPGNSRYTNNPLMPNIPGGYIDTGYTFDKSDYFSDTILPSYNYRNLTGVYNHLLEEHLITRFETLSGSSIPSSQKDTLLTSAPTTFAKLGLPWYTVGQNKTAGYQTDVNFVWDGWQQTPTVRDTYFSPITFIHDYTLDNYHGTGGSNYADACKIRVGITFYPVYFNATGSRTVHYWQAVINPMEIINTGSGYTEACEFILTWPPVREPAVEDATQTPYFPDQEAGFKMPSRPLLSWFEDDILVKRTAKEAIYQESHNKDSMLWYLSSDSTKFRVKFKIIITEVST